MLKVKKDSYKYNIIYLAEDGVPLSIVIKELVENDQHLSVLYLKDNDINTSIDIWWDDGLYYFKSHYGSYKANSIDGICEKIEKIYKNMIFT